jgi:hypothetical protein
MKNTNWVLSTIVLSIFVFSTSPATAKEACKWGGVGLHCAANLLSTGCIGLQNVSGKPVTVMVRKAPRTLDYDAIFTRMMTGEKNRETKFYTFAKGQKRSADFKKKLYISCSAWKGDKLKPISCFDAFNRYKNKTNGGGCGCENFTCLPTASNKPPVKAAAARVSGTTTLTAAQKKQLSHLTGNKWKKQPGKAVDIAAGKRGAVYKVDTGGKVWRWNGLQGNWSPFSGRLSRIDVGPGGNPVGVNKADKVYRYDSTKWVQLPGAANEIGIGAEGTMWVINKQEQIYRWNNGKNNWDHIKGNAVRIDVDPQGNAWVVNKQGDIYRYNGKKWVWMTGKARDISIGADGTVMVIGTNDSPYVWKGNGWNKVSGKGENITVDMNGDPWVTNKSKEIFSWDKASLVEGVPDFIKNKGKW